MKPITHTHLQPPDYTQRQNFDQGTHLTTEGKQWAWSMDFTSQFPHEAAGLAEW